MKKDAQKKAPPVVVFRGNQKRIVATREAIGAMKYKAQ